MNRTTRVPTTTAPPTTVQGSCKVYPIYTMNPLDKKQQQFDKQQFKEEAQHTPYVPCILLQEQQFNKQQFKKEAQYTLYVPCILLKEQQFNKQQLKRYAAYSICMPCNPLKEQRFHKQQFKEDTQHTPCMPCSSLEGTTVPQATVQGQYTVHSICTMYRLKGTTVR